MIQVACYKNKSLPVGFVVNSYEADLVFTGVVVDNDGVKTSLKFPFDFALYGSDELMIKDDFGKSYLIDATETIYATRDKLIAHINRCLGIDYYKFIVMSGQDFITVDYDLTKAATSTLESIRASISIFEAGAKYYAGLPPHTEIDMTKFTIEPPFTIRFNEPRDNVNIEVYIRDMFYPI